MKKTEMIQVTGMSSFLDQINELAEHNQAFDLTVRECCEAGLVGERIYEQLFSCQDVRLEPVPREDSAFEPCRIRVMADGLQIGWVKPSACSLIKTWLDENVIRSLSVSLQGGPYRLIQPEENPLPAALTDVTGGESTDTENGEHTTPAEQAADSFELQMTEERGQAGYFAMLKAECEFPDQEETREKTGGSFSNAVVSTTYETRFLEEDPRKRGFIFLLLAAMLTAFYLAFSGPYWTMVRLGRAAALPVLGGDISDRLLYPHLGLAAAALILTFLAIGLKSSIWAVLAALAYTGSAYTLPGFAVFVALQALFCLFAALRRPGRKGIILVKLLGLAAVLAGLAWFLKPTVLDVMENQRLVIRPTGTGSFEESTEYGDDTFWQDEYGDDEEYDYEYDYEEDYEGDYD